MPSGAALIEHWLGWCGNGGQRRILEALVDAGAPGLDRATLAARAGMEPGGGTFTTYLGRLRTAGLIEGKATIKAADVLLEAKRRG